MSIELFLTSLNKRLDKENRITIQRENGEIINVTCDWNSPISNHELQEFSLKTQHVLPKGLSLFLKQSNGAKLFNNDGLGLDFFEIFNLSEMLNYINEYDTNIYYQSAYDKNCLRLVITEDMVTICLSIRKKLLMGKMII